jgi:hypothetical protein
LCHFVFSGEESFIKPEVGSSSGCDGIENTKINFASPAISQVWSSIMVCGICIGRMSKLLIEVKRQIHFGFVWFLFYFFILF